MKKRFVCSVCGYIYDEEKEGKPFSELSSCPVCRQPSDRFTVMEDSGVKGSETNAYKAGSAAVGLNYDPRFVRHDESCRYMEEIHTMAVTGKSIGGSMGTRMAMPGWDDILILGAQLNPMPLNDGDPVRTTTVIGKNAKRPMILDQSGVHIPHVLRCIVKGDQDCAGKRFCHGPHSHVQRGGRDSA